MKKKYALILSSPLLIVVLIFLLPPLGMILLGMHSKIPIKAKLLTGTVLSIFVILFFLQYQCHPKIPPTEYYQSEALSYEFYKLSYPDSVLNSLNEISRAKQDYRLVQINYAVKNNGNQAIFYVSLVDQPGLFTHNQQYFPDLTLSREPFGGLNPQQKESGYLIFQIPLNEEPLMFNIAQYEFKFSP